MKKFIFGQPLFPFVSEGFIVPSQNSGSQSLPFREENVRRIGMKKILLGGVVLLLLLASAGTVSAKKNPSCVTIQDGTLVTGAGDVIQTGYDQWGYNYQALMFNGKYCDAYRDAAWCQAWKEDNLMMKWNDAWLSNKDCDGDGLLDRHSGYPSYIGSGAWLTNHMSGEYEMDGQNCKWTYFTKIVAAPADAVELDDVWYSADGTEIGAAIWGDFATIQTVNNDACGGYHGLEYNAPAPTGFGFYQP
jgi:hypothetical protein